ANLLALAIDDIKGNHDSPTSFSRATTTRHSPGEQRGDSFVIWLRRKGPNQEESRQEANVRLKAQRIQEVRRSALDGLDFEVHTRRQTNALIKSVNGLDVGLVDEDQALMRADLKLFA